MVVLGIEAAGGEYAGAPPFGTVVEPGTTLVVYGRRERLAELDRSAGGAAGDRAHDDDAADARARG